MSGAGLVVVLVNEAQGAYLASLVTPAWLARCAAACWTQLLRDAMPVWGAEIVGVRVGDASSVQPGEMVFAIVDELPQAPDAIAYHDVGGGAVPVAFLALSTCSTLDDVSTAISHELLETLGDPACNRWDDDGQGHEYAHELCDAVESNSYPIDLGDGEPAILVSDFALESFFAPGAPAPYTYCEAQSLPRAYPSGPFGTASGGYQILRDSGSNETQVTNTPMRRPEARRHSSSRTYRRGARV